MTLRRIAGAAALTLACAGAVRGQAPAASPTPAVSPTPAALAAAAEAGYARGLVLYRSGQLEEARLAFDAAVDGLLSAGVPVKEHPELQHELDTLLDRIEALELDALQSGTGLGGSHPRAEEAAGQLTFPIDEATRAQVESELRATPSDLPLMLNDAVIRAVTYYTTHDREDLVAGFRRAGRYRAMVNRIFGQAGIPLDLIYVAQEESGFDPLCNTQGAKGLWQFEPSRADDYHLARTAWVDERLDPEKSTQAAADHLKDLYNEFGDWLLAIAAYNAGPETVQRAVAETGYADFWELAQRNVLPRVTHDYVPLILAMALIAKNRADYDLQVTEDPPIEADRVVVSAALDLRLAADCAKAALSDLQRLNPSLLHLRVPTGFVLQLPAGTADHFRRGVAAVPAAERLTWRVHWMAAGETLAQVAASHRLSVATLAASNHLAAGQAGVGTPLGIPPPPTPPAARGASIGQYRTQPGDTWASVARKFGIAEATLRKWNPTLAAVLAVGTPVRVQAPAASGGTPH